MCIRDRPSAGIPVNRATGVEIWERLVCADTAELGNCDYSYKAVKAVVNSEQQIMQRILTNTVLPVFYGAMPNLGLYTQPDGPVPNPVELLPQGKIDEARACQEEAMEYATRDMAVSYTHLDVYKRQCHTNAGHSGKERARKKRKSPFLKGKPSFVSYKEGLCNPYRSILL